MRLLVITQVVDAEDPILAATVPKLKALASRCDQLVVLAGRVGAHDLPANATIRSFGAPDTLRRGLRFVRALAPFLLGRRVDAVLAHMSPIYLVLAAPLAKPMRVPLLLWYTHPTASRTLRLASKLASARTTATPTSFPLPAAAEAIGHGIDVEAFPCRGQNGDGAVLDVLALGRYSAVKGYETVLRAVHRAAEAGIGARLTIHGPTLNDGERRQLASLERLRSELGLQESVHLREALPPAEARERLGARRRARQQHGSRLRRQGRARGLRELRAGGCVDWPELLPDVLRFDQDDTTALAARLGELAEMGAERRAELGRSLREAVVERHSTASWADAIVRIARDAAA